jgi:hypothetical protein
MSAARLKHFGWGREGEGLTAEEEAFVVARVEAHFSMALRESASAPRLEDIRLEAPRIKAPSSLPFCTSGTTIVPLTPTENHIPSSPAAWHATMRARPMSSPIRATRRTCSGCSTGPPKPTRP